MTVIAFPAREIAPPLRLEPFRRPRKDGGHDMQFLVSIGRDVVYCGASWRSAFAAAVWATRGRPDTEIAFGAGEPE